MKIKVIKFISIVLLLAVLLSGLFFAFFLKTCFFKKYLTINLGLKILLNIHKEVDSSKQNNRS